LNPKEWPYGRCGPEGCPTTGSITIEMVVNVFSFPEVSYDRWRVGPNRDADFPAHSSGG
jgi:hypothetical protein